VFSPAFERFRMMFLSGYEHDEPGAMRRLRPQRSLRRSRIDAFGDLCLRLVGGAFRLDVVVAREVPGGALGAFCDPLGLVCDSAMTVVGRTARGYETEDEIW
jgi:hypothetical protein